MKKILFVLILLVNCKTYDVYNRVTYQKANPEKVMTAINQACAATGFVIQYSNPQGTVNTEWKAYTGILVGERIRFNITFTGTEIKVRQLYSYMNTTTNSWEETTSEAMDGAKGVREKLAAAIQQNLPSASVEFVREEIKRQ